MASLHLAQEIFDLIYPVGSVYLSVNQTNPGTLFGGTWTRIKDGFLYCAQTDNVIGAQGNLTGSNESGSTTLTVDQIPSHKHEYADRMVVWDAGAQSTSAAGGSWGETSIQFRPWGTKTNSTGGGKGHSHIIPYTGVAVWKRTA